VGEMKEDRQLAEIKEEMLKLQREVSEIN